MYIYEQDTTYTNKETKYIYKYWLGVKVKSINQF